MLKSYQRKATLIYWLKHKTGFNNIPIPKSFGTGILEVDINSSY